MAKLGLHRELIGETVFWSACSADNHWVC